MGIRARAPSLMVALVVAACGGSTSSTPRRDAGATDATATDAGDGPVVCDFGSNNYVPAPQPTPASCNPAWNPAWHSCGPDHDQDCCSSTLVPGGGYDQGCAPGIYCPEAGAATLSPFKLDVYEVTVSRFRAFVEHGWSNQENPPPTGAGKNPYTPCTGWDQLIGTDGYSPFPKDKAAAEASIDACLHPASDAGAQDAGAADGGAADDTLPYACASRAEAIAFCAWDGGFLPSLAEWGFAAAGGAEQRYYPWSVPSGSKLIDAQHAVYNGAALAPVGSRSPLGDGRWGQADLAGNVAEWVPDEYAEPPPYLPDCHDCETFVDYACQVVVGGDATASADELGPFAWNGSSVGGGFGKGAYRGLRCARKP